MKFMKLGSKADCFHADGDKCRYVATDLASDITIKVGEVKFFLHKFPLLSKSACLQKLVAISTDDVQIQDLPGGPAAFEICAKFCYGMTVTLNAYNVVAARCAAEYLEMYETVDKGNLIYKIEVFLNSSIFRSWKDSIIVLQTTRSLLPWSEELKVVNHCLDSIASMASIETSKVDWSYTYNRKKLSSENDESDALWKSMRKPLTVPKDWWVEDLCELNVDMYKRVISSIKTKDRVCSEVIGEALHAYALRRLPGFSKGVVVTHNSSDYTKYRSLVENLIHMLPSEKRSVSCRFLLKLLRTAILLDCGETDRNELMRRTSQLLEEATVADLLIRAPSGGDTIYNVDIVQSLVKEFVYQEQQKAHQIMHPEESGNTVEFQSDASRAMVAKLIDGYLAEIARDPNLSALKFVNLAEMVSSFSRSSHDGIYRAIDTYLKEHPGVTKSERKRICKLMNCKKLSAEACMHAMQNERLPLRVVVQVLFFEQIRATTSAGNNSPPERVSLRALLPGGGSNGSSRSTTTNTEEDWDSVPTAEDIKALKGELATLRLGVNKGSERSGSSDGAKTDANKMKSIVMSKIFSKMWSSKERNGDISSSSDTSESNGSDETKSTPKK